MESMPDIASAVTNPRRETTDLGEISNITVPLKGHSDEMTPSDVMPYSETTVFLHSRYQSGFLLRKMETDINS